MSKRPGKMGRRLSRPLPTSPPPWAAVSSGRRGERDQACQHAGFDKTGSDSLGEPQTFGIVTIYNGASRPPETAETEQSPLVGGLGPSTPGVHPWGKNCPRGHRGREVSPWAGSQLARYSGARRAPGIWSPGAGAGADLWQACARLARWRHQAGLTLSRSPGPTPGLLHWWIWGVG